MVGGALGGMRLRRLLPDHHLAKESEDVVRLGMGVIATMSALVIGLLLASAKGSFDLKDAELKQFAADLIQLDRHMAHYGAETKEARDLLRRYTAIKIDSFWPGEASHPVVDDPNMWRSLEDVQDELRALAPLNDAQRWLKENALQASNDLARIRWLMREQLQASIPQPFMVILIFWLTVIFGSFGLFGPPNATVIVALIVSALSIAGALFLIVEMDQPFGGAIHLSSAPVRAALELLGR
jgi:hypothetical protein